MKSNPSTLPDCHEGSSIVVFDIDGVLADPRHRLHHIEKSPRNWKGFFADASLDPVMGKGIALLREAQQNFIVVLITGRPQTLENVTLEWMRRSGMPEVPVLFRSVIDHRPGKYVKEDHLTSLGGSQAVSVIYEDDEDIADYLVSIGYNVVRFG